MNLLIYIAELVLNWNGRLAEFVANKRKDEKSSKVSTSSSAGQNITAKQTVVDFDSHSISSTTISVSRQTSILEPSSNTNVKNSEGRISRSTSSILDDASNAGTTGGSRPDTPSNIEQGQVVDLDLFKDHQQVRF